MPSVICHAYHLAFVCNNNIQYATCSHVNVPILSISFHLKHMNPPVFKKAVAVVGSQRAAKHL